MHLTGTELLDWIALRRVYEGGVAMHGSEHLDRGRKVPCYLPDAFCRLADAELSELRDPGLSQGATSGGAHALRASLLPAAEREA